MSSLTRWDPFRDVTSLRDAMNQVVEQAVMRPGFGGWNLAQGLYGQMIVFEAEGKYQCQVLLPGISPDEIELTVRQNTLTLKATVPEPLSEEQRKNATYLLREFGASEFTRSVAFPKDVNADAVEAQFEGGILTIVIPLAQHAQPRRITIRSGSSGASQKQVHPTGQPKAVIEQEKHPALAGETRLNGRETSQ